MNHSIDYVRINRESSKDLYFNDWSINYINNWWANSFPPQASWTQLSAIFRGRTRQAQPTVQARVTLRWQRRPWPRARIQPCQAHPHPTPHPTEKLPKVFNCFLSVLIFQWSPGVVRMPKVSLIAYGLTLTDLWDHLILPPIKSIL